MNSVFKNKLGKIASFKKWYYELLTVLQLLVRREQKSFQRKIEKNEVHSISFLHDDPEDLLDCKII